MSFFMPEVKFTLHGAQASETRPSALANRSRALEATLKDYLRRKEFNRSAEVRILRTVQRLDGLRLIVQPSGVVHEHPLPEQIPGIVEEAVAAHRAH